MDAAVEATTATAVPQASEDIIVGKADGFDTPVMEAATLDEPKQEVESAAAESAAALAAPEPEPAEGPAAAAATPAQDEGVTEVTSGAVQVDTALHEPLAVESADEEPAATDAEPVEAVAPPAEEPQGSKADDKEPAAAAAAEAAAPEAGDEAAGAELAPAEKESAGDASTAVDSAAGLAAPGSAFGSTQQPEQEGAAAAANISTIADSGEAAATDAGKSADAAAGSVADKVADAATADEAATAAANGDAAADGEKEAALVEAAPAAGTVAAAKAMFLRSQTSGDSATGAPSLAPLSMRGSRISSASTGAARASSNGVALVGGSSLDDADEATHIKVRELREQLSATHPNLTGGSLPPSTPASPGREDRDKSPLPLLSEHDKVNTVNVAELLRTAEFKLVPGIDRVPYEELIKLRLEDGVDVTRKEEYLSDEDFKTHLGVDREAYQKLPEWKKLQLKKGKMLF